VERAPATFPKEFPFRADTFPMSHLGRRRHKRVSLTSPIQVSWQDPCGIPKCFQAIAIDISDTGIRFALPEAPEEMATVQMRSHNLGLTCTGTVRTCSHNGAKFVVGIEFTGTARFNRVTAGIDRAPSRPQFTAKSIAH
jgi:hypothetical protein